MGILLTTFAAMAAFLHNLWRLFKKPEYRAGIIWLVLLLVVGVIFYHEVERLSWLDALYFSVITISTVGYGDFSPTTTASKVFTMVYILFGMSIFVSFASMLVHESFERQKQRAEKKAAKKQSQENE
jgi:voltage-gated potassium channel